jgi:hypothetical protein
VRVDEWANIVFPIKFSEKPPAIRCAGHGERKQHRHTIDQSAGCLAHTLETMRRSAAFALAREYPPEWTRILREGFEKADVLAA